MPLAEIVVPSDFICPISLQLMRDPVTISSGHTFDRTSIDKWLDDGHNTCPLTRQPIIPFQISSEECIADDCIYQDRSIPNHMLRRMIQEWCEQNESFGVQRISTPQVPPLLQHIPQLLSQLDNHQALDSLQKLLMLAMSRPHAACTQMLKAGALPCIAEVLCRHFTTVDSKRQVGMSSDQLLKLLELLMTNAEAHEKKGYKIASAWWKPSEELTMLLAGVVARVQMAQAKSCAVILLSKTELSDSMKGSFANEQGLLSTLVDVMKQAGCSMRASQAALTLMLDICSSSILIDILPNVEIAAFANSLAELLPAKESLVEDKANIEMALTALHRICHLSTRGSDATRPHIRRIAKHMSGVSEQATEHAVDIIWVLLKKCKDEPQILLKSAALRQTTMMRAIAIVQNATLQPDTRLAARKIAATLSRTVATLPDAVVL